MTPGLPDSPTLTFRCAITGAAMSNKMWTKALVRHWCLACPGPGFDFSSLQSACSGPAQFKSRPLAACRGCRRDRASQRDAWTSAAPFWLLRAGLHTRWSASQPIDEGTSTTCNRTANAYPKLICLNRLVDFGMAFAHQLRCRDLSLPSSRCCLLPCQPSFRARVRRKQPQCRRLKLWPQSEAEPPRMREYSHGAFISERPMNCS